MTTKHTPGPWGEKKSETGPWAIFGADGNWIATTCKKQWASEDIANARLIAAAPDLLDAAELVIAWYEAEGDHSKADFYKRIEMCRQSEIAIRAAIAKATGA